MSGDIKPFLLRLPRSIYKKLRAEGTRQRISVNSLCTAVLSRALSEHRLLDDSPAPTVTGELGGQLHDYVEHKIASTFGSSLVGVILFGSAARGELKKSSDIDLIVVLERDFPLDRDVYSRLPSHSINGHPVSPLIVHYPDDATALRSVWLEAAIDGFVLSDAGFRLSSLLARIRSRIASGSIRRSFTYGVPYWIHHSENGKESVQ